MKVRAAGAIAFLQCILFLAHWFIFHTLLVFWPPFLTRTPAVEEWLEGALFLLSISFVVAALLAHRFSNVVVSLTYTIAAIWLGLLNFLFWGACLCWATDVLLLSFPSAAAASAQPLIGAVMFGAALLISVYGIVNARYIRRRRITVTLPHLPPQWKGRTALLVTDIHLGNINAAGFARRIVGIAQRLDPSIIFVAGDLYDGSKVDPLRITRPLFELAPPHGVFFCGGNHEDFGDPVAYTATLKAGGIRVLHNEGVLVDGLRVIGVSYADSTYPAHLRAFLEGLHLAAGPASILLNHVPHRLPIVEQSGVSLQLSGHTHGGQFFPFTLVTRWVYGRFTYGLQRFGNLQVLTSSGVGTWGPPMRVGTQPEVVLITFA